MEKINIIKKYLLVFQTIKNVFTFILDYLKLISGEKIYFFKNNPYSIISRAGTNDCKEIVVLISGYEYPLDKLPIIHNPVILDVGAHIGCFSFYAMEFFKNMDVKILCIEPAKDNYQLLKRNFEMNNIDKDKYILCNCAVGSSDGMAKLNKATNTDGYHISETCGNNYEICQVYTLPTITKKYNIEKVDILKLDIEGGEYDLFNEKENMIYLNNQVSYIMMEYHDRGQYRNKEWIINCLKNDFEVIHERDQSIIFKNRAVYDKNGAVSPVTNLSNSSSQIG